MVSFFPHGIVVFGDIFIGNKCHRPLEFHLKMSPSSATSIRHDFCIINTLACHKFNTSHPNALTIIIFIMWTEKPTLKISLNFVCFSDYCCVHVNFKNGNIAILTRINMRVRNLKKKQKKIKCENYYYYHRIRT